MKISFKKTDFSSAFYFLALASTLLTIMVTFIDVKGAKVLFYWSVYFSLAGILVNWNTFYKSRLWFIGLLAAVGLSKVIWFYWEYLGDPAYNDFNDYFNAGKRILLACCVGYWLFSQMKIQQVKSLWLIRNGLLLAFCAATIFGFYQYFSDIHRVVFSLDRATISAYGYAMLSTMVLFMLASEKHTPLNILACLTIFCLSYFVLVQTGTRNMMAAYPVIILLVGVLQFRHFGLKSLVSVLAAIVILVGVSYKPMIKPKLDSTLQEYTTYIQSDGNKFGSLTTRLAMWKVGTVCFIGNPLGMKTEDRTACFENYVKTRHKDKVSLMYEKVHLHNELLDSATLQGIQGALVMLLFYVVLIVYSLRSKNALLLSVMFGVVISGLTDVVFISRELTICVALMLIICEMFNFLKKHHENDIAR
ncbi:O-antigen ligase family protein [Erwinia sp.]|uniref:O-antigen ligase family protein n=1 Tax=Erwinia citreus TaxID=558 RepID=UPI003C729CDF